MMLRLLPLLLLACSAEVPLEAVDTATSSEVLAADCAKGCSGPTPDETHPIADAEVAVHMQTLLTESVGEPSLALETLLFHPAATSGWLDAHPDALDPERRAFLRRQLARHDVRVEFRLVDEQGALRGEASRVTPLKEKQHVALAGTGALKRIEINGKTKRVGLEHLWSRW